MTPLLVFGFVVLWSALLVSPVLARRFCRRFDLIRPNFRGDSIPAAVGVTFLLVAVMVYPLLWLLGQPHAPLFLLVAIGFGVFGLLDDLFGDRGVGGFRGHLRALFSGQITTGAIKLLGGGALALLAAGLAHGLTRALIADALLIALAANALNLLDTRPGRALFGFALLAAPSLYSGFVGTDKGALRLLPIVYAALIEWPADARARAMLGDTGSNLLGAAAGLAAVVTLPVSQRLFVLCLLLTLNLAAERISLNRLIERTPWLRALDRRLGVR